MNKTKEISTQHEYKLKIEKKEMCKFSELKPEEHFIYYDRYYIKEANKPIKKYDDYWNEMITYNATNIIKGNSVLFEDDDEVTRIEIIKFAKGLSQYKQYVQIVFALSIIALIDSFVFGILYLCPFWFIFDFIIFISINIIMLVITYYVIYGE